MFDRTREIETVRFRIIGENKILRFIERNREDRERIESRTKNLSIRFIDFIPLSFHIEIVARKRVTSFNRETDDSSQIYYFPLMEKELKKRRHHKARPSSKRKTILHRAVLLYSRMPFFLLRPIKSDNQVFRVGFERFHERVATRGVEELTWTAIPLRS